LDINLLLNRIKQGDKGSFKQLFYHLYPDLVAYAKGYLYDKNKSEDIVQDVFLYLWEHAKEIEIDSSLKSYLFTMTRNKSLNYLRSIKMHVDVEALDSMAWFSAKGDDLTRQDHKKEFNRVMKIVQNFPTGMRQVFTLKYFDNLTYLEVAEALDISVNTVKTQLKRAKIKLLSEL